MICLYCDVTESVFIIIILLLYDTFIKVLCSMCQVQFVSTFPLAGNALSGLAQHLIDVKV